MNEDFMDEKTDYNQKYYLVWTAPARKKDYKNADKGQWGFAHGPGHVYRGEAPPGLTYVGNRGLLPEYRNF